MTLNMQTGRNEQVMKTDLCNEQDVKNAAVKNAIVKNATVQKISSETRS